MAFWNPLIGGGGKTLELEITANTTNYNIKTEADNEAGGNSSSYSKIILTIPSTVIVGSTSTGTYALDVGEVTASQDIEVINNGAVVGKGGNGGNGVNAVPTPQAAEGTQGGNGGSALKAPGSSKSVTFVNNGILGGGGGGGQGSQKYPQNQVIQSGGKTQFPQSQVTDQPGVGGGGGAGYNVGTAGSPGPGGHPQFQSENPAVIQGSGPYTFLGGGQPGNNLPGSAGGVGGNLGQDGGSAYPGPPANPGGLAGPYLDGSQYVTLQGNAGQGPSQTT
jgi:hypothetical protein